MCSNNHIEINVVLLCKIYSVIRAPEMDELKVSFWEWPGSASDEGQEASEWFTHYLGKPSRLVRFKLLVAVWPGHLPLAFVFIYNIMDD